MAVCKMCGDSYAANAKDRHEKSATHQAFAPNGVRRAAELKIFTDRRTPEAAANRKRLAQWLPPVYWDELL